MGRTDDDSWGITEGVGATAMGMALARAAETVSDAPLFEDPYAQHFVDAAIAQGWTPPYSHATLAQLGDVDASAGKFVRAMTDYSLCRTRFFDEFFAAAAAGGIRQVVVLAAGLDARTWRLPWRRGTVVYEIDQPQVVAFKAKAVQALNRETEARSVLVPLDLRDDWPKALLHNGFDTILATAWSVEGLLPYLPPEAQDLLFERINELSANGSRIVVDAFTAEFYGQRGAAEVRDATTRIRSAFEQLDGAGPADMLDRDQLIYEVERADVADWLTEHGWSTSRENALDTMTRYGRRVPDDVDKSSLSADLITAERQR
jgi:methyltransferase (TIGR00027 family)